MEDPNEKRLQDIQMVDLGTARREYLSTVDKPNKFRRVGLTEIEQSRLSNYDESVLRLVQLNKPKISAWTDFHMHSGDTGNLEALDAMMDGQTHRAQLNATIKESGGQIYVNCSTTKDNFIQVSNHANRGRGGGVAGRGSHISATANIYPGGTKPTFDTRQNRHLDPALDPEGGHVKNRRGHGAPSQHLQRPTRPIKPTGLKSRRPAPLENYESRLSAPEHFLEAVRSRRPTTNPINEGAASAKASTEVSGGSAKGVTHTSSPPTDNTPINHPEAKKPIESAPVVKPLLAPTISSPQSQASVVIPNTRDPEKSVTIRAEGTRRDDAAESSRSRGNRFFASNLPQPQIPTATVKTPEVSKTKLNEMDDLLLDFASSTSVPMAGNRQNIQTAQKDVTTSSPGIMDLIGLDYQQASRASLTKTTGPPPVMGNTPSAHRAPRAVLSASSSSNTIASLLNEESIAGYLHELALINDAIATASVTTSDAKRLNERKEQLETILSHATKAKLAEKTSHIEMEDLINATEGLKIASGGGRASSQSRGRSRTAQQAQTTVRRLVADENRKTTGGSNLAGKPISQESTLREAVTAPPFVPRSSARFQPLAVRTPQQRIAPMAGMDPDVHTNMLFGDHLLPGRSGGLRSPSSDTISSLKSLNTKPSSQSSAKLPGLEASRHAFEREISTPQQQREDPQWVVAAEQYTAAKRAQAVARPAQENVSMRPPHANPQLSSKARTGNGKSLYASRHAITENQTPH